MLLSIPFRGDKTMETFLIAKVFFAFRLNKFHVYV
jgi:hypothetical protein